MTRIMRKKRNLATEAEASKPAGKGYELTHFFLLEFYFLFIRIFVFIRIAGVLIMA